MTSVCPNHPLVNPAVPGLLLLREFEIGSFTAAMAPRIACDRESVLSGLPVHLSADFGVVCESPHPPIAVSAPPCRPRWNRLQSSLGKYGRAVGRGGWGPQDKDMVPTDAMSQIAGHGCLQVLREPCSLFAFVSLCRACVCTYTRGLVPRVLMWVCVCGGSVCVCVWPSTDSQMKVSAEHLPSDEKGRHEASPD